MTAPKAIWLLAALVVATALINAARLYGFFHDDAFISLRYARNLAEFGDLAWNPGERVEGYTNPLHMLLASALIRAGVDGMLAVRLINFTGLAFLWPLAWLLLRPLPTAARLGAMAVMVGTPVLAWTYGGLEPVPAAALVAAGLLAAMKATESTDRLSLSLAASTAFGLAYLMRPGALVLNLALGLAVLFFAPMPPKRRMAHFIALGSVSALILLAHLLIRHDFYGSWMPMTYFAKVGLPTLFRLSTGLDYLAISVLEVPVLIVIPALLLALRHSTANATSAPHWRRVKQAVLVLAAMLGYVVWSGGDHMLFARMLVPVLIFAAIAIGGLLAVLPPRAMQAGALVIALVMLAQAALRPATPPDRAAAVGATIGRYIAATYPPGTTIALATAGSVPYFATDMRYIDTLGLNDPVIARRNPVPFIALMQGLPGHSKGDGAYVLSRKPDVIVLYLAEGTPAREPLLLTDAELLASPEFHTCYRLVTSDVPVAEDAPLPLPPGTLLTFYRYERTCPK